MPYSGVVVKPQGKVNRPRSGLPAWLCILVFLASVYILWVLPHQLAPHRIDIEFEPAPATNKP